MPVKAERVGKWTFRLAGVTHTRPPYPGALRCGGQVFAERLPEDGDPDGPREDYYEASWECYCETCLECDVGGYDSLRESTAAAPEYWTGDMGDTGDTGDRSAGAPAPDDPVTPGRVAGPRPTPGPTPP